MARNYKNMEEPGGLNKGYSGSADFDGWANRARQEKKDKAVAGLSKVVATPSTKDTSVLDKQIANLEKQIEAIDKQLEGLTVGSEAPQDLKTLAGTNDVTKDEESAEEANKGPVVTTPETYAQDLKNIKASKDLDALKSMRSRAEGLTEEQIGYLGLLIEEWQSMRKVPKDTFGNKGADEAFKYAGYKGPGATENQRGY